MAEPRDRLSPSFSFGPIRRQKPAERRPDSAPPSRPESQAPAEPAAAAPAGSFRQWVGAPRATLAIAFTDMVSSSALGNKLGNRAMDALRRRHFAHADELVRAHDGFVVKTIGDSVMAAFRAATDALDFAMAVHADTGERRVRIRVGIHVGPITVEERDAFGATVNYTARVVAVPGGDEIWLSSEAKSHIDQERAPQHGGLQWLAHKGLELKGFPGKHILWSLVLG